MKQMFPEFKKLDITDAEIFNKVQKSFPPYSDHHFTGRFFYDVDGNCEYSVLNDNLIIKYDDYIDKHPIYTFIGENKLPETIETLTNYLIQKGLSGDINVIPEHCIKQNWEELKEAYEILEDRDNFDYIISVDETTNLLGEKFHTKRKKIHSFLANYPNHKVENIDINDAKVQQDIEELFLIWEKLKNKTRQETNTELEAIKKCIKHARNFNLLNIGIYIDNKLVGFTINEILNDGYYVGHFGKFHPEVKGGSQYIEHMTAKYMKERGCTHMNYEQDLGIANLRHEKTTWNPVKYLKKYTLRKKPFTLY